jgi:pimeloyl-ACP methyl ester carboxylesterase
MGHLLAAGEVELWVERRGTGPEVLLIHGLGDTAEAWQRQLDGLADSYRLTAFDNRGAGRSSAPDGPLRVEDLADDAAALLRALDVPAAHVAGYSGGSIVAQELAIRHPELVRSLVLQSSWARLDAYVRRVLDFFRWLPGAAPSERAFLEAFYLWFYTPRAHADGTVDKLIDAALAAPAPQSPDVVERTLEAFYSYETYDRLPRIAAPTLVLSGGLDLTTGPRFGRVVADRIPGAVFEVLPEEAHQPFQEIPDRWNTRVDDFWRAVDGRA